MYLSDNVDVVAARTSLWTIARTATRQQRRRRRTASHFGATLSAKTTPLFLPRFLMRRTRRRCRSSTLPCASVHCAAGPGPGDCGAQFRRTHIRIHHWRNGPTFGAAAAAAACRCVVCIHLRRRRRSASHRISSHARVTRFLGTIPRHTPHAHTYSAHGRLCWPGRQATSAWR